ncbi:MAG TPA: GNAT family N-acetyltransferase [Lysobacter sp.]|nr:GNAT family N-acetyltransferase [Lysobacter sp.]
MSVDSTSGGRLRPFRSADLPAALALQASAYAPALRDSPAAFASRLAIAAGCCRVAERDGELCGYILAHPWPSGMPPAVDTVLDAPPDDADRVLYVHDLSVSSTATGAGFGRRLVDCALDAARRAGLQRAELVAVPGAAQFWQRLGFEALPVAGTLAEQVHGYGREAVYMGRVL